MILLVDKLQYGKDEVKEENKAKDENIEKKDIKDIKNENINNKVKDDEDEIVSDILEDLDGV